MAKVKNRRDNHITKRPKSGSAYDRQSQGAGGSTLKGRGRRQNDGNALLKKTVKNTGWGREDFEEKKRRVEKPYEDFDFDENFSENILIGRNPVMEAMKSGREIDKLLVSSTEGSMIKILGYAKDNGIKVVVTEKPLLDRICKNQNHQGVIAYISPYEYGELDEIIQRAKTADEPAFIIVLDNLEDPHNLGSIIRSAECAGAHGVIIPKRRACGLTETVAKASCGGIEYMPVARVNNISRAIETLKENGIWIAACDMGDTPYYKQDLKGHIALVIGSEGKGISKLVKEKCDFTCSMPMVGKINSLNASNAACVLMYEVRRQRDDRL